MAFTNSNIYERLNILEHAKNPSSYGKPKKFLIKKNIVNRSCGDEMTLYLVKEKGEYKVYFTSKACSVCVASASMFLENLKFNSLKELNKLKPKDILSNFGVPLSPSRKKCALLVYNGLKLISKYEEKKV